MGLDDSEWDKHLPDVQGRMPGQFWICLLKLVASRHFERACLMLRQLLLDGHVYALGHVAAIEAVLDCMLSAPVPLLVAEDPHLVLEWIQENRLVLADSQVSSCEELRLVSAVLSGDLDQASCLLNWQERLAAELFYKGTLYEYEDISNAAKGLNDSLKPFDALCLSLLHFDPKTFVLELGARDPDYYDDYIVFNAFLADLLTSASLLETDAAIQNELLTRLVHTLVTSEADLSTIFTLSRRLRKSRLLRQSYDLLLERLSEDDLAHARNLTHDDYFRARCTELLSRHSRAKYEQGNIEEAYAAAIRARDAFTQRIIFDRVLHSFFEHKGISVRSSVLVDIIDLRCLESIRPAMNSPHFLIIRALEALHHVQPQINPAGVLDMVETLVNHCPRTSPALANYIVELLAGLFACAIPLDERLITLLLEWIPHNEEQIRDRTALETCKLSLIKQFVQ